MRVATLEATPVSFPYVHREVSSLVARDGVTDVIVRIETDDGVRGVGRGLQRGRRRLDRGRDPRDGPVRDRQRPVEPRGDPAPAVPARALAVPCRNRELRVGRDRHGARRSRGAGSRPAAVQAVRRPATPGGELLLLPRARDARGSLGAVPRAGSRAGFDTFYLKVGVDPAADLAMVEAVRAALGSGPRLRLDANGAWSGPQASRLLGAMAEYDIDFVEQPVRHDPVHHLAELRGARADAGVRERGPLERGGRLRAHRRAAGRRVLLQPVLGRLARARSSVWRTSRTSRGCRSASTRTASSVSRRPPATTCCSRCRTASRGISRPRT